MIQFFIVGRSSSLICKIYSFSVVSKLSDFRLCSDRDRNLAVAVKIPMDLCFVCWDSNHLVEFIFFCETFLLPDLLMSSRQNLKISECCPSKVFWQG